MSTHTLTIALPRPPMTANDQRRAKWPQVRAAKQQAATHVHWAIRHARLTGPLRPCHVEIVWHAKDKRIRDSDSLGPFIKAALDALVAAGVLADDDSRYVLASTGRIALDRTNPRIEIILTEQETPTHG